MFAHINSPQTIGTCVRNPAIETNVVDPILRRGYRFCGRGSVHDAGELYERGLEVLAEHGYDANPDRIRAAPWRERMRRRLLDR